MFHVFFDQGFNLVYNPGSIGLAGVFAASVLGLIWCVPRWGIDFFAQYGMNCYHIVTMSDHPKTPKARSKHSFRDRIRAAITRRIMKGESLAVRQIIDEAGGGSASTVLQELADAERPTPGSLLGREAVNPYQRIDVLVLAINASVAREQALTIENQVLKNSLATVQTDLDGLLATHQDSQRMLLQGVDDLRQMVKAGQGATPPAVTEIEEVRPKTGTPTDKGDAILWQARHDQLLKRFIELDAKNRKLVAQLFDLGVDVD